MKSIAIIYHYLALYRQPVFRELCLSRNPSFTLISGEKSTIDIKTIDKILAEIKIEDGGLRWTFVRNLWITKEKVLWQTGIIKNCLSNKFDGYIFLGNPYFISTWIATSILKLRKKPVYFWTHGLLKNEYGLKKFIRKIFLELPDGLFLYGEYTQNLLIKQGFSPEKLHVVFNSLDYNTQILYRETLNNKNLLNIRSQFFKNETLPQLIFIGRLTEKKKLHQIIDAMNLLHKNNFQINLLIVGNGEEKQKLQKVIAESKLDDYVYFYGESYDEANNYKLIASSDICISPGEVGLTAMHALVYGTPVITHNNYEEQMPEFEAIVAGFSGDFFEQNNITSLAQTIKNWLVNHTNRKQTRQNCYAIIDSKYNPQYQKEIICNVFVK